MDIDRPVVLCHECGAPVEQAWMLYCRACWRKLNTSPSVRVLFDKQGRRYKFDGHRWYKVG
jgi:predicted amidophosphoribosyltransferase